MMAEKDQWLPEPPPARSARREAAIEAALRRYDGIEEAPAARERPRRSWMATHRPAFAMLVSAMLLVIVGIPAALIGIRQAPAPQAPVARVTQQPSPQSERFAPEAPQAPSAPAPLAPAKAAPAEAAPSANKDAANDTEAARQEIPPVVQAPPAPPPSASPMVAAAPPPAPPPPAPPPPPPPSAAARAQVSDSISVSGTHVKKSTSNAPSAFESEAKAASPYPQFLSRLQAAVRAGDRGAVMALIAFPLRVNGPRGSRLYDAPSALRDYDRIFTPKVKRAILNQRGDRIFSRDIGAMAGDGEVWFTQTCPNPACSPAGPVRIVAVNP
jgi:hypothetical protein